MAESGSPVAFYVVKAEELVALNYLPEDHPRPLALQWINRATDRQLSPSNLEQLLRTLFRSDPSPSILKLRKTAGLRAAFELDSDRQRFASEFAKAVDRFQQQREYLLTGVYETLEDAQLAAGRLFERGVPEARASFIWQANRYLEEIGEDPSGYSRRRVLAGVSGGGIAGATLGVAILALPGVGPVAAAGAALASAFSSVATVSGIIGATGAAMATMLSDPDVDGLIANYREEQLKKGRIFLAIDTRAANLTREEIRRIMEQSEGLIV